MRILPGHYLEASWADDLLSRCACVAVAEPRAVVSHRTALQLRGVPVPTSERGRVHVVVPQSGVRPRWRGVVVHRSHRRTPPTVSGGVSVTGVARAWCGSAALVRPASPLAAVTGPDLADLVAALDVLAARSDGALGAVRRELAATSGGRGAALARSAIALHDPRAESAQESRLRVVLTLAGLPPGAVQHEVHTQQGRFVARVDLACRAARWRSSTTATTTAAGRSGAATSNADGAWSRSGGASSR